MRPAGVVGGCFRCGDGRVVSRRSAVASRAAAKNGRAAASAAARGAAVGLVCGAGARSSLLLTSGLVQRPLPRRRGARDARATLRSRPRALCGVRARSSYRCWRVAMPLLSRCRGGGRNALSALRTTSKASRSPSGASLRAGRLVLRRFFVKRPHVSARGELGASARPSSEFCSTLARLEQAPARDAFTTLSRLPSTRRRDRPPRTAPVVRLPRPQLRRSISEPKNSSK